MFFEIQVRGKAPIILAVSSPLQIILSPVTNSNEKKFITHRTLIMIF